MSPGPCRTCRDSCLIGLFSQAIKAQQHSFVCTESESGPPAESSRSIMSPPECRIVRNEEIFIQSRTIVSSSISQVTKFHYACSPRDNCVCRTPYYVSALDTSCNSVWGNAGPGVNRRSREKPSKQTEGLGTAQTTAAV